MLVVTVVVSFEEEGVLMTWRETHMGFHSTGSLVCFVVEGYVGMFTL